MTAAHVIAPESGEDIPIQTFADILRAMSRDPALAEAVRWHVLDDELRRLPAAFQQLAATVEDYMAQTNRILAELQAGQAKLEVGQEELRAGQVKLEAGQAKLEVGQAKLEAGQEELRAGYAKLEAGQGKLEAGQEELRAGQGKLEAGQEELRAGYAKLEAGQGKLEAGQLELQAKFLPFDARRMIGVIARRLNIRRPVWLDNTDLLNIADDAGYLADAVPENELESFFAVDLALRAVGKAARDTQYVVIECSNTVDRNDILRIRRNADLLARFTGCHTHAMVIGNRLPERIASVAEASGVHWLLPSVRVTRAT